MNKIILLILLLACFLGVKPDYCQPNYVLGDFPEGIMNDMYLGATTGDVPGFSECSPETKVASKNIGLWFNNKNNPDKLTKLDHTNPKGIATNKPTIILIHGWLCNVTSDLMPQLKDAYLKRYGDVNVIRVEWTSYATDRYINSYCYIPKVAEVVAKFLCNLKVNFDKVHLVGHSMGAQTAGIIGKEVQKQCKKKVGRITGLDPAGPLYQKADPSDRLASTDAKIVDVIHTNQLQLGYKGPCGTVDFYPNCGYFQPNSYKLQKSTKLEEMKPYPLDFCNDFKTSCSACEYPPPGDCKQNVECPAEASMGENYPNNPGSAKNYIVVTNGFPPFSRGFVKT